MGSYCGKSTIGLGYVAKSHGRSLATVDHHLGSIEMLAPSPYFDPSLVDPVHKRLDSALALLDTLELAGLRESVTVLVSSTLHAAEVLTDRFALVFLDGGHDSLTTWLDYLAFAKRVTPGGYLAIHDVFADPVDGGRPPYEIATAALHSGSFTLAYQTGSLVALRRGKQLPQHR
ncbi:MAG: class I SAM-dependent methyltransferase [Ferrimicrobium sp.]